MGADQTQGSGGRGAENTGREGGRVKREIGKVLAGPSFFILFMVL